MSEKKVRSGARPDAKTLKEPITAPDGEAAKKVLERKREREAVPRAPLDLGDTPRGRRGPR